mmetsp:Transcript_9176/g.16594  ORF Transcript_9176/g.16594 Transcript_9176/m.16594 type:complete len:125 (+) Transcript_9176:1041-1415(+)
MIWIPNYHAIFTSDRKQTTKDFSICSCGYCILLLSDLIVGCTKYYEDLVAALLIPSFNFLRGRFGFFCNFILLDALLDGVVLGEDVALVLRCFDNGDPLFLFKVLVALAPLLVCFTVLLALVVV